MRIGLADVNQRVVRRQGEPYLVPQLLRRGERREAITALIALHEEWLGRERGALPPDRAAELIGDYRLARCLVTTLTEYYAWTAPAWPGPASAAEGAALAAHDIATPGQLRLALYDMVNARHGGYLAAAEREPALDAFAADLGVARATLDALLTLDADAYARLERTAPAAPTPDELRARYNQRAVEALLANAALVEWIVPPRFATLRRTSLGTILKRICFLARRMGIYYDVTFAEDDQDETPALGRVAEAPAPYAADGAGPAPLPAGFDRALCLTLYGPQEAFGAPNQYGDRLARLCRALLGYGGRPAPLAVSPLPAGEGPGVRSLRGEARVYLRGRPFRFALDEALLALLDGSDAPAPVPGETAPSPDVAFDSGLERDLYAGFAALARAGATHGWRIEREPEPILCGATILIPDFALTRDTQRVYLEVAGYWSPAYRERKRRKLAVLAGRVALALALPESARADLESLAETFPALWFSDRVSPQALVTLLETRFNDFPARRARVRHADVLAEVERRGLLPWSECAAALHAYGPAELAAVAADLADAAPRAGSAPPVLVDGVGLATPGWLGEASAALAAWVTGAGAAGLALDALVARLGELAPGLAARPEAAALAEALAWATGHAVVRESLFAPRVIAATPADAPPERPPNQAERVPRRRSASARPQPHRPLTRNKDREEGPLQSQLSWENTPAD
jgi:predicted nuclease of restriction endonuclease-like RecB superfamily